MVDASQVNDSESTSADTADATDSASEDADDDTEAAHTEGDDPSGGTSDATSAHSSSGDTTATDGASTNTDSTTDTGSTLKPGWVAIEPVAEGLSDCSADLQQNENWCSYPVDCAEASLTARCELRDDVWQCTCQNGSSPRRDYTLTGEMAATACEASIALCVPGQAPEPAAVCHIENESASSSRGTCVAAESFVTTIPLEDGVTAVVTAKSAYSECSGSTQEGVLRCGCRDTTGGAELHDVPVEEACEAVVPWCKTGFPVPDETWEFTCLGDSAVNLYDADPENDIDECSIQRQCGRRTDVGSGYALFDQVTQSVSCDGSRCSCDSNHALLVDASDDDDGARCVMVDEFCYGDVTAAPTGSISATNVEIDGDETACSGAATAEQWVSWDEQMSVGLTGDIWAFCDYQASLTWTCRCASSGFDSANFELEGPDFTAVCGGAMDRCIARARVIPTLNAKHPHRAQFEFLPESALTDAGQ